MESNGQANQKKIPELLAPAGNMQSFLAAIESGADAVYVGAKDFSARHYAENFSDKELDSAVKYAHMRGVNVYLALNTLILDEEMNRSLEVIYKACTSDVDAIIVQDIGLASSIKSVMPELKIHASTQMTVHNFEGVNLLKKLGFRRVILSRELSLNQVNDIVQRASDIELEVFIHGALCVSYSGQCLFSSLVGGRSGNRGRCAQPCRQKYKLTDCISGEVLSDGTAGEYLLSTKDLCTVELLPQIVSAGVHSLKIEGRMKSPEYVATVTRIYRKYLDFIGSGRKYTVKQDDIRDLELVFNRGGFTSGFIGGEKGAALMSMDFPSHRGIHIGKVIDYDSKGRMVRIEASNSLGMGDVIKVNPGDEECTTVTKIMLEGEKVDSCIAGNVVLIPTNMNWKKGDTVYKVYDKKLIDRASLTYSGKLFKKVPLYGEFTLSFGKPIELIIWDDEDNKVEVIGKKPAEEAKKVVLTPDKVLDQLEAMGNTPFYLAKTKIQMEDELFVTVSEINDVRRRAVDAIGKLRIQRRHKQCEDEKVFKTQLNNLTDRDNNQVIRHQSKLSVFIPSVELLPLLKNEKVSRIYVPWSDFFHDRVVPGEIDGIVNNGKEVFLTLPRITHKHELLGIYESIKKIENCGFSGALIGNYGLVKMFKILKDFKVHADFSFNLFNSLSAQALEKIGLDGITISPELEIKQLEKTLNGVSIDTETIIHGRVPLLVSKYCVLRGMSACRDHEGGRGKACEKRMYGLKDKTGVVFPLMFGSHGCAYEVLNSKTLCLAWDFNAVKSLGVKFLRLSFTHEKPEEVSDIIEMYSRLLEQDERVLRDYEQVLERIKQEGFTRGHYFRGVE